MVCVKVYGVSTEKLAIAVHKWLEPIVREVIGKRHANEIVIIVIPTLLAATTFRGNQLVEITYTRPFQQRIKSRLVPDLLSDLNRVHPPVSDNQPIRWDPVIVLVPAGEAATQQSLYGG